MIVVQVPASSANLGPGFDVLGMALNLFVRVTFTPIASGVQISGCDAAYQNKHNLCYQAYKHTCKHLNQDPEAISIHIDSQIPIGKGLGSSAALIMAGVLGANALFKYPLDQAACLELACELEHHPDNLAAALYGGCLAITSANQKTYPIQIPVSKKNHWLLIVPNYKLATKKARAVLPKSVSYQQATYNLSQLVMTLEALKSGKSEALKAGFSDSLHQPYRQTLIPEFPIIQSMLQHNPHATAMISGAGPSVLVCINKKTVVSSIQKDLQTQFPTSTVLSVTIQQQGATIWQETTL